MSRVVWVWRKRVVGQFWVDFRKHRAGVVGLVVFVVAVILALVVLLFIDAGVTNVVFGICVKLALPSLHDLLGIDESGWSILLMIWWGLWILLLIGFFVVLLSMVIGTVLGIAVGYFWCWAGAVILRVTDWFFVLSSLVTALVLAAILGGSTATIIVAIGVILWLSTARLIWVQTLAVEVCLYIERSLAFGAGHWHIIMWHVLPNVAPLLLVSTMLEVVSAIVTESTLAFFGVSVNKIFFGERCCAARTTGVRRPLAFGGTF